MLYQLSYFRFYAPQMYGLRFLCTNFFAVIFTDQMQRRVEVANWPPRRIVSIVPSQTELLFDLGLEQQVLGITKFCVRPEKWFREKQRVGGTKTLNLEKIAALKPDLIIGNKEENQQEQVEALARNFPVWMSDIATLPEALAMIRAVGHLCDRATLANTLAKAIESRFEKLRGAVPENAPSAAYLIWRKPYMAAGSGTFIHEMLGWAGFKNAFGHKPRYPETSLYELAETKPQVILLSSEPYPFAEKHIAELAAACQKSRIVLVDGELFSWYGSRLLKAPEYFQNLHKLLK